MGVCRPVRRRRHADRPARVGTLNAALPAGARETPAQEPPAREPSARTAELALRRLAGVGGTLAVAESLTAGLVTATLARVPGASAVLRGGVTAYAAQVKRDVLGVDADLLARVGTVDEEVCRQMCLGAARLLGADHAVATTGVAGPGPAEGHAAGTVWIGAIGPRVQATRRLVLAGPRVAVRPASAAAVLALLSEVADGNTGAVHAID